METPVAAIILSAGNSSRMGREKALLPYGNGLTFAGQLIRTYTGFGCRPVTIVVNESYNQPMAGDGVVNFILNCNVDMGRSHSIHLGLQEIPAGLPCFIQNIDNPFTDGLLLQEMIVNLTTEGYVVPEYNGKGGHPVLLSSRITDHLRKMDDIGNLREELRHFSRTAIASKDERILRNINTPGDYLKFVNFTHPSEEVH